MTEIDVLQTGKMLVSSAVHNREAKTENLLIQVFFKAKKAETTCLSKHF